MMHFIKKLPLKYIIATIIFVGFMLFLDQNDWITQYNRRAQIKENREHISFLKNEIETMSSQLENLKSDNQTVIEKVREKYLYKKDNEDIFVITRDTVFLDSQ